MSEVSAGVMTIEIGQTLKDAIDDVLVLLAIAGYFVWRHFHPASKDEDDEDSAPSRDRDRFWTLKEVRGLGRAGRRLRAMVVRRRRPPDVAA